MSATDELRKLLDERGVEWGTNEMLTDCWTWWNGSNTHCMATEINGRFSFSVDNATPKQAIIATLGGVTAKQVRELIAPHLYAKPTFDFGHHGAVWSADFQAIADELNIMLGAGTCRMETDLTYLDNGVSSTPEDTWAYRCNACDWSFRYERGIKPRYCPECGAKVV